ncbi:MAG: type 4a pilus biogenesis protein PilO [Syntrophales bacterium]
MEQKTLKVIGLYAVIILALIRFVVYPLYDASAKKQILFNDLYQTFQLKAQHAARQGLDKDKPLNIRTGKEVIGRSLYEKGMPFSAIQADVLENIIKIAEKNGLMVQSFEMQEPTAGKVISDVPVLIRLTGKPEDHFNLLKTVQSDERIMLLKSLEMTRSGKDILLAITMIAFRMEK